MSKSVAPFTFKVVCNVVAPSTFKVESKSTAPVVCKVPVISKVDVGLLLWMPTFVILYMFPLELNPQKSWVLISAMKVGLDGFGIGVIVVVPIPRLLTSVKFNTVKDFAIPVTGI